MEGIKDHMTTILDQGLYESAAMLGCFLVSSSVANMELSPYVKSEHLVLLADALYGSKEFRRALNLYKQALQHCKTTPKQIAANCRTSLSSSSRSPSPNSVNISTINENEIKFKIALCHCALNENRAALTEMEAIPAKARTIKMNLTMGKLYRIMKNSRAAIASYKECLRHCPYILEAIISLADLGLPLKDILASISQTPNRGARSSYDQFDTSRWLSQYAEARCCVASSDYKGGLEQYSDLLQRFPCNVHILLEMAKVEGLMGKHDEAMTTFEKARSVDPYIVTYMDEYAMLLKTKTDHSKLNMLLHDLLNIDPSRAEVLVTMSVLWDRKDDKTRALSYADKSLRVDDRNIPGYIMKGNLCLSLNKRDEAASAFRGALELRPDLRSYQGLVRSYLVLCKPKEALYAAREAMKTMPQSAKALTLVGDVYASHSSGREKARKFYESALRLESGYLGAVIALADLHVVEGRNSDAISLLERYLKDWADDSLHTKLAQVLAVTNMLQEAVSHYQQALRINPGNEAAKKGLQRMEKQMKGLDPDAPDEEDDNEAEDAEDPDEGELL